MPSLLSTLVFSLATTLTIRATPVSEHPAQNVALPFTKHLNFNSSDSLSILHADQARVKSFLERTSGSTAGVVRAEESIPVVNQNVYCTVDVDVGSPPTQYSVLIDTGSSNTFVGVGKKYVRGSTSVDTGKNVSVSYGSGGFSGRQYIDTVSFGKGLQIHNQSIGAATSSAGLEGVNGILGIGPVGLTLGSLNPGAKETIPTVTDNLFSQHAIPAHEVGVYFEPARAGNTSGDLTFGGIDASKLKGNVTYAPVTKTAPASNFWGLDASITYGANTAVLNRTSGFFDTGTTLILIASDAYKNYQKATNATLDQSTGLLSLPATKLATLKSMFFHINGVPYELTANAQIWPRALYSVIGGTPDNIYLVLGDLGQNAGAGIDYVAGLVFLERFYSVYDTKNQRVGFAATNFTHSLSN
ncbi:hypothetical protein PLICRDRAFT_145569 [Plicaturopsis crispa FD-325 SS-3]|nr:hypothetical protein PLICRDRAFT_145569 [Plicaturopsis crispa FD-325 SS-3]